VLTKIISEDIKFNQKMPSEEIALMAAIVVSLTALGCLILNLANFYNPGTPGPQGDVGPKGIRGVAGPPGSVNGGSNGYSSIEEGIAAIYPNIRGYTQGPTSGPPGGFQLQAWSDDDIGTTPSYYPGTSATLKVYGPNLSTCALSGIIYGSVIIAQDPSVTTWPTYIGVQWNANAIFSVLTQNMTVNGVPYLTFIVPSHLTTP
jgi:hypothetical protein